MLGVALMLVAAVMVGAEAKTAACRRKRDEGERSQRKLEDVPTLKPPQEVPEEECRQGNWEGGGWGQDGDGRDEETGCGSEGKGGCAGDGGEEERSERGQKSAEETPEEEGGVA